MMKVQDFSQLCYIFVIIGVKMVEQVEISSFDLRYEGYRLKNPKEEKSLLTSILEKGIREPLQGVNSDSDSDSPSHRILLDGFKRYRCAQKLKIAMVPYHSLGNDEAFGIITLLRIGNSKHLNILEQAKLIDELQKVYKMSIPQIAGQLEKSTGWVGMRAGLLKQMSSYVMGKIFNGDFPAYAYMYTLRPFIRMKDIKSDEIDEFVGVVSGKNLSIRDLDILSQGYFNGSDAQDADDFRQQLKSGDISWVLSRLKEASQTTSEVTITGRESRMLRTLENMRYSMDKICCQGSDSRLKSPAYCAQANLLAGKILKNIPLFKCALEELYDRTGKKKGSLSASS
jgi:hypothetical protein